MTRSPRVDSACRFFPEIAVASPRTARLAQAAIAIGLGLTLSCGGALAQNAAKGSPDHIKAVTSAVDGASIKANTATSNDWPTIGLDYAETRFSASSTRSTPTTSRSSGWCGAIRSNPPAASKRRRSWSTASCTRPRHGAWCTPSTPAPARGSGPSIPKVDREKGYKGCCDVVNRGVALWKGKVFVGAYDGRLIALDAVTGKVVWEKDTLIDKEHSYTITGAPRVFNGKVVIGNGGAEYGARGYVTAYDAETGNQAWRWFTVPGDPSKPFEDESMAAAAKTWDPAGKYWINGGGGTAWDTITFDPDLNMVYIGTGNGSPWNRNIRSPSGGDNLYLASLVALNADTGKYVWHYQETPGDHWDYTSTQPMILADITIDGAPRKVILHAPKNGFFFVVDRTNGKFISAKNFVDVNWATGYDANGRPIEVAGGARRGKPFDSIPGPYGAHNWHPMSFNPQTGLVYLPAQDVPLNLTPEKTFDAQCAATPGKFACAAWLERRLHAECRRHQRARRSDGCWPGIRSSRRKPGASNMWRRGMAARSLPPAIWCSRARPTGASSPTTPPRAKSSGRRRPAPAWSRRPRPICSTASNMSRSRSAGAACSGSLLRATELQSPGTVYTFAVDGKAPLPAFVKYQTEGLLAGVKYDPKDVRRRHRASMSPPAPIATACPASTRAAMSGTSAMFRPRPSPT